MWCGNADGVGELFGTLFKTSLGWCSIIFTEDKGIVRLYLPSSRRKAASYLKGFQIKPFKALENIVIKYFKGVEADFGDFVVLHAGSSSFRLRVYRELRKTKRGEVLAYRELAMRAGNPKAARAVGSAMARNPVPLIIPCHRVIKSDGALGKFGADGGVSLKRKMLELEGALLEDIRTAEEDRHP